MKRAITIKEQIAKLRNRGVIISNEQKAEEVLLDIGYFRLCSYFFPFEESYPEYDDRTHQFVEGTTFEDAVALYYFDFDLRLPKSIRRGPAGKMTNENKYILCGMLKVLYYMIGQVSTNRAKEMQENVQKAYKTLEEKAPNIYQQIVEITGYNALFVD